MFCVYTFCSDFFGGGGDISKSPLNETLLYVPTQVEKAARNRFGSSVLIQNLSDLDALAKADESEDANPNLGNIKVVVIGTLYKNQTLKPNILKDLSEDQVCCVSTFPFYFTNQVHF
jgi:hypothetical protein